MLYSVFFLVLFFAQEAWAKTLSLVDVYNSALTNTEVIKRSQARLDQAIEKKSQSQGAIMPTVSLRGNYLQIQPPAQAPGTPRGLVLTEQYSSAVNITQPVFRGFKEFSVYRQTKTTILLNQYLKDSSKITLYQSVINAYYNLLIVKKDLENLKTLYHYSEDRVRELKERARIGKSRKGELLQAEAQLANTHAQLTDSEGQVVEARAQLAFFLRDQIESHDELQTEDLPEQISDLDSYLGKALDRPDLKAKLAEVDIANEGISQAKGNHYPTVDLFGNYYLTRTGVLQTSKWDVGVTASLPIFQGGTTVSQVREAAEKKNETILSHEESKKTIERDVMVLHESVTRSLKQLKELEIALHKAEVSYKENLRDYRYGTVTNLDVIVSLNSFVETKRNLDRVRLQTLMSYKNLEAQAGVTP